MLKKGVSFILSLFIVMSFATVLPARFIAAEDNIVPVGAEYGPWCEWSTTPITATPTRQVETRQVISSYDLEGNCCGNSSGVRCYLKYMQSGYTLRLHYDKITRSKSEVDSWAQWTEGSYYTYASNVNGWIIGPGTAYIEPYNCVPYFIVGTNYETQYRYRDMVTVSITGCTVTLSQPAFSYDGTEKKPTVIIQDGTKTLTNGIDYTVMYSNNKNIGIASVIITGRGDYSGSITKDFIICGERTILGDADSDELVSIIDATAIQRYLGELSTISFNAVAADVDRDGDITILDATIIQRYLVLLPVKIFGIGEMIDGDTDIDGLTDYIENVIGTDPLKIDTDGDGLTDYQEVILDTDPLTPNIYNENLDSDSDGITDIEETAKYRTDPFSADTDSDGLTDYKEIYTHQTNPLLSDSDYDTLSDKFEIDHGLDPNNVCTDGTTPDAEVSFDQNIDEDSISPQILSEDNVALPDISGEAQGDISDNIYIAESGEEIVSENRSIIGKAIDVTTGEKGYDVSGLTLSFDMKKFTDLGGDTKTLTVCKVNDEGEFELLKSTVSGNTVSCTMDTDGTYCVIDVDEFLNRMGINIYDLADGTELAPVGAESWEQSIGNGISGQADIVFAIDTTGSMDDEINGVERNVKYFAEKLRSEYDVMVNYALIDFRDLEEDGYDTTKVIKNGSSNWFSNTTAFSNKVDTMYASGGGDDPECAVDALETARILDYRTGAHKFIILITDAEYKILNRYGIESMEEEAELLSRSGIVTCVVTSNSLKSQYQVLLDRTNGIFANITSSFGDVLLQLADMIGEDTSSDKWAILKHGYTYVELPEDSDGDYDDDGLSDAAELGSKETVDLTNFIKLRLQIGGVPYEKYRGKTSIEVYNARSNPTKRDTDNDGIGDSKDTAPWAKGLADGIVGGLRICSYSDGPSSFGNTSGHAYLAYTSYIDDDLNLYGMYVDSVEKLVRDDGTFDGTPAYHLIHMASDDYITLGAWGGSVPDHQKGTWINEEKTRYNNNAPSDQHSLTSYITYSDVQKFNDLTKEYSTWSITANCSYYAARLWNEVTDDNLAAHGALGFCNPSSLSNNMLRRNNCHVSGLQKVRWPD